MSDKFLTTDKGYTTLDKASVKDFWYSQDRRKFAQKLESGKRIPECQACWQEEDAGKESKRIRDNREYKSRKFDFESLPIVLDLSMGNLCNLKCRICSSRHSTPWLREDAEVYSPNNIKGFMKQPEWVTAKKSFEEGNDFVWEDIKELVAYAERFDFAGGEPFYIPAHWKIIEYTVAAGYSKNQYIHYNTNGSIFPEKYINLLDQFQTVDIQISSDGVGDKFEYLRHGSPFQLCEENIDKFLKVRDNSKTTWHIGACLSVSAFNIFDFFETYEHYAAKGLRMYVNVVWDHHGIRILPEKLKEKLIKRIENTESKFMKSQWQECRDMICNILKNTTNNQAEWDNFWKEIRQRDQIRNENFETVFPEYFNLAKEYINV
jgi:organic radical activating enzyme